MKQLSERLIQKRDVLNVFMSIGIMFLVGSCMTLILIVESNPKKELDFKRTLNNNDVVNNSQTPNGVIKTDNKNDTNQTQNNSKAMSDTTRAIEARTTQEDDASQCSK